MAVASEVKRYTKWLKTTVYGTAVAVNGAGAAWQVSRVSIISKESVRKRVKSTASYLFRALGTHRPGEDKNELLS